LVPGFLRISEGFKMVLRNIFTTIICATLLAWSGLSGADEYRPDQLLGLDLSQAVLSPKPLGPPAEFAPVPVEASADRGGEGAQAGAEPKAGPWITVHEPGIVDHKTRVAHSRAARPRGEAATKLAHRHGNPLDAQAFDTRIQAWPCKSGGICDWKR
jgi:hypothetical protein